MCANSVMIATRHEQRADAVREVDRDRAAPVVGDQVAEHQREVRNRQPRAGMPHRRADEDLRVDQHASSRVGDAARSVGSSTRRGRRIRRSSRAT